MKTSLKKFQKPGGLSDRFWQKIILKLHYLVNEFFYGAVKEVVILFAEHIAQIIVNSLQCVL